MHRKNIFPKINSKNHKPSALPPARTPAPATPEPESKIPRLRSARPLAASGVD